ncbi:Sec-independent protein translocase TatB [Naasia sp. SYSU D00948]|uniref:Sec-independent protein translocase TatB n=1 Tax=Naasia sp. SYSU D00948 TaxID=2817379 RepID=UPI001B308503|nr:Sec-independent protein translocase TatB [Naasia sp. SYSU D00948]
MMGLTFEKLLLLAVLAVVLLGPDRLPRYAGQLARLVKSVKAFADNAKDRMREEMGPEFDEVDWKKLDPRQYDPRRIIREALLEDEEQPAQVVRPPARSAPRAGPAPAVRREPGGPAPFDSEAT